MENLTTLSLFSFENEEKNGKAKQSDRKILKEFLPVDIVGKKIDSQFTKWRFDNVVNQDTSLKSLKNYC